MIMKVFIIFMAFMILNINSIVFHNDLTEYRQISDYIEKTAENCAHAASMYYDEYEYSDGFLVYDGDEGCRYTEYEIARRMSGKYSEKIKNIDAQIYFFNENGTCEVYFNGENTEITTYEMPYIQELSSGDFEIKEPSVVVELRADIKNPFRQGAFYKDEVIRSSIYSNYGS